MKIACMILMLVPLPTLASCGAIGRAASQAGRAATRTAPKAVRRGSNTVHRRSTVRPTRYADEVDRAKRESTWTHTDSFVDVIDVPTNFGNSDDRDRRRQFRPVVPQYKPAVIPQTQPVQRVVPQPGSVRPVVPAPRSPSNLFPTRQHNPISGGRGFSTPSSMPQIPGR